MLEVLKDTIVDSLKLIPFLFITYVIMELIEHKAEEKTENLMKKSGKFGPVLGAFLGVVPQCGFSAAAANLYAAKIITRGTIIAIFLSTSDEMLPILISHGTNIVLILEIILIKIIIGIIAGLIIDLVANSVRKFIKNDEQTEIHKICEHEHCNCEEDGIIKSSIKHTLQIFSYVFIISFVINSIISIIGEETIADFIEEFSFIGPVITSAIGMIPNCASSVIITELYLENIIPMGTMIAGLLVNSGVGLLVLFKVNKNYKDNIKIITIILTIGIISGFILDLVL